MFGAAIANLVAQEAIEVDNDTEEWIRRIFDMPTRMTPRTETNIQTKNNATAANADAASINHRPVILVAMVKLLPHNQHQLRGMLRVEQDSRENPLTRLANMEQTVLNSSTRVKFPYKIGTYFATGNNLYFIVDYLEHEKDPTFLIENCHSGLKKWIEKSMLIRMRKEVITPSERLY